MEKEKAKKEAEERAEAEAAKGDAEKFEDFIADLAILKVKYKFTSKKYMSLYKLAGEKLNNLYILLKNSQGN